MSPTPREAITRGLMLAQLQAAREWHHPSLTSTPHPHRAFISPIADLANMLALGGSSRPVESESAADQDSPPHAPK